jgi:hypothetical protein
VIERTLWIGGVVLGILGVIATLVGCSASHAPGAGQSVQADEQGQASAVDDSRWGRCCDTPADCGNAWACVTHDSTGSPGDPIGRCLGSAALFKGRCWHPDSAACTGANGDGWYCGGSLDTGLGLDPNTLFHCVQGELTEVSLCAYGCGGASPNACDSGGQGRDGACGGLPDGPYCGGTWLDGDPDTLYQCVNGSIDSSAVCPNGCGGGVPSSCK